MLQFPFLMLFGQDIIAQNQWIQGTFLLKALRTSLDSFILFLSSLPSCFDQEQFRSTKQDYKTPYIWNSETKPNDNQVPPKVPNCVPNRSQKSEPFNFVKSSSNLIGPTLHNSLAWVQITKQLWRLRTSAWQRFRIRSLPI